MVNKDIIENWGVPESIKDKNIEFIFNTDDLNSNLKNDDIIQNLLCDDIGAKFCLYDKENNKIILTMSFIILGMNGRLPRKELELRLDILYVNDSDMRKKGIATYYLEKLIEFGITNNINKFKLNPNPYDELFKNIDRTNTLDLEKLKAFYIKRFDNLGFSYDYSGENNTILEFKKLQTIR